MKIVFSARATAEFKSIARYFMKINPAVAKAISNDIRKAVKLLDRHPEIGKRQDVPGTRRVVSTRYGYLIYYRPLAAEGSVEIITIIHGRQQRPFQDN
jgi:toxin ParE1/3/4